MSKLHKILSIVLGGCVFLMIIALSATEDSFISRNFFSGEIRVVLNEESNLKSLNTRKHSGKVIDRNTGLIKLGYGKFSITVDYINIHGDEKQITFHTAKLNRAKKLLYTENPDGSFTLHDGNNKVDAVIME